MRPTRPVLVSTAVGRHRALQFVGKKIVVPGFVRGCSQMPVTVYRCPIVVFVRNFISKCDNTYAHMYVHEERHIIQQPCCLYIWYICTKVICIRIYLKLDIWRYTYGRPTQSIFFTSFATYYLYDT